MPRHETARIGRRREMAQLLREREERGESLRALSERTGIPVGTLSWWRHQLKEEAARRSDQVVELIEVAPLGAGGGFELVLDGVTVRVPMQFDPESLATLLQVLAEC